MDEEYGTDFSRCRSGFPHIAGDFELGATECGTVAVNAMVPVIKKRTMSAAARRRIAAAQRKRWAALKRGFGRGDAKIGAGTEEASLKCWQ